jgi:arsenite-transporting ATPase
MQLERDLARAGITPFAWIVNQTLTPLDVTDPVLRVRRGHEAIHLRELAGHAARIVLEPWMAEPGSASSSRATAELAAALPRDPPPAAVDRR